MKTRISILFFLLASIMQTRAQNGFDLVYDFCTDTAIASVVHSCYADTNRFFVFGGTNTEGVSPQHGFLAAFDYNKQLLWSKKMLFPGWRNSSTTNNGIIKLGRGKYLTIGMSLDTSMNTHVIVCQPYLYMFSEQGDSMLFKQYNDSFKLRYFETALFHNNNIIIAGCITSKGIHKVGNFYDYDSEGVWICKYDTLGNVIWEREYMHGPVKYPDIGSIVLSADSQHYVIAGDMRDTITQTTGTRIIKIDTAGTVKWIKPIPKKYLSWNYVSMVTNPTGGYYFVSSAAKQPDVQGQVNYSAIYYGKLNEDGDTLWTRIYSDSFRYSLGYQIQWDKDNKHLVILGGAYQETKPALMKIDTLGNVLWWRMPQHRYVDPNISSYHSLESMSMVPDGRYLMAGFTIDSATGGELSWMILTDSNGCRYPNDLACSPVSVTTLPKAITTIQMFPNPATDMLYVDMPNGNLEASLILTDVTGKLIFRKPLKQGRNNFEISTLPTGMYFVKMANGERLFRTEKLLKQ